MHSLKYLRLSISTIMIFSIFNLLALGNYALATQSGNAKCPDLTKGENIPNAGSTRKIIGRVYFVDPSSGNDDNCGSSKELAWRSFANVNKIEFAAGDRVEILGGGDFHNSLLLTGKGGVDNPIRINFAEGDYNIFGDGIAKRKYHISNTNDDPYNDKAVGLLLENAEHFRICGDGANVIARCKMMHVAIDNCKDIQISGLSFDYKRPTVSEFTVIAAAGQGYYDLKIHEDSWFKVEDEKIVWIGEGWTETGGLAQDLDLETGRVFRLRDPLGNMKAEQIGNDIVRIKGKSRRPFKVNHVYQLRNPFRDCVGVFTRRSSDIGFKNVHFRFIHGMGLVSQFSEDLTYQNVIIAPDPKSGRTTAFWADGIHASGCKGRLVVKDCKFSGGHDDAINFHGTFLRVSEIIDSKTVKVEFAHHQTYGFMAYNAGDAVEFVRWDTLEGYARNTIAKAEMVDDKNVKLTLAEEFDVDLVRVKDVVENITWNPQVFISGCQVRHVPTHGFLIATKKKAVIENCTFFATGLPGILLGVDAQEWFESGTNLDVTISNNEFLFCREPSIKVSPRVTNEQSLIATHKNIKVTGNRFRIRGQNFFGARLAGGILIEGNSVISDVVTSDEMGVDLFKCKDVKIKSNRYEIAK